jgi:xanthine dehydrogenase accessory factor
MRLSMLEAVQASLAAQRPVVVAVRLRDGERRIVPPERGSALGELAAEALAEDRSRAFELAGEEWFLQVFNPPLRLFVIGAVHIAQALVPMARLAGYAVTVIDPRRAFASPERFPGTELATAWPNAALAGVTLGPRAALVSLTHDPKLDDPALAVALASECFYIGALGSRRTHAGRLERLAAQGFEPTALARIRGPVGLDIGARSPGEIAVSILAEMTQTLRTKVAP